MSKRSRSDSIEEEKQNKVVKKTTRFDEESISEQKGCPPPYKNAKFPNKSIPAFVYLHNWGKEGSAECGPGLYPKFIDGKYCCVEIFSTPQEHLDYINMLLQSCFYNINTTVFSQYSKMVIYLLRKRNEILASDTETELYDNIELPEGYTTIDGWIADMNNESRELKKDDSNRYGGKYKKIKKNKISKKRKSIKRNYKKITNRKNKKK
jgi:hypothetical protein